MEKKKDDSSDRMEYPLDQKSSDIFENHLKAMGVLNYYDRDIIKSKNDINLTKEEIVKQKRKEGWVIVKRISQKRY